MKVLNPLKAIRKHCVECSGGLINDVRDCEIPASTLYPYRFGCRPKTRAKREAKRAAEKAKTQAAEGDDEGPVEMVPWD